MRPASYGLGSRLPMTDPSAFSPPRSCFFRSFAVAPDDIDVLGHANNVSWVRWVQDMATSHSDAVGLDLPTYRKLGVVWVVRRHDIEYLAPAFVGEEIRATTWVAQVGATSSLRRTVFRRERDGVELARAETTWVLVDGRGKPVQVPPALREPFERVLEPDA